MRAHLTLASLLALTLFGLAPRPAHAQSTCSADSDCVKGWTCQVSGGSGCASPGCAPGETCEPLPSDCAPAEYKSCRPAPCGADSDCASGMVCYTHTESDCPPSACASGQECPAPTCEPRTESACVPRYLLPCTTASDCGTGFECVSGDELCACDDGSAPAADGAGGGVPPTPTPPSCTCATQASRCVAPAVNCNADGDCLAGWTCAVVASTSDCASTPESNAGSGAQGGATPTPEPPDCRPSADVKQCVPPYYGLTEGGGVALGSSDDASSGPTPSNGEATAGNVPPRGDSAQDESTAGGGCSVGHGSRSGSTLALLGALGLFGALRRRRAR